MRTALVRAKVQRLLGQRPFRPFGLLLEKRDRDIIEHSENIALTRSHRGRATFT